MWETLIPRPLVLIRDLALFLESEEKDLFEIKVLMVSLEYSFDDIFSVWPARDHLWVRVFCRYYFFNLFSIGRIVRYLCAINIYIYFMFANLLVISDAYYSWAYFKFIKREFWKVFIDNDIVHIFE